MTRKTLAAIFSVCIAQVLMAEPHSSVAPPEPYGPVPTANQLDWHEMEYYGLVCYGLNTYTGQEWGYGDVSPDVFKPTDLDTDQWARVASQAGMKGLILVAKHHDGFCLWPSKTTDYTIAATSWKDGKGDILGDLAESCRKYGLKLGVYISPWDRNHAEYGREKYIEDYFEQWREVLTHYGPIFEVWFDGANGGTGYYGGAREQRTIPKGYYQFEKLYTIIKERQPNTIFFGYLPGVTEDTCRWVGNEAGLAPVTNWCRFDDSSSHDLELLGTGLKDGKYWMPAEADTTILHPKKWYYNPNSKPRTLRQFVDLYYTTIGRNASFNLGLSIGPEGTIPERDVRAMLAQKQYLDKAFAYNLAVKADITANNHRGQDVSYEPEQCVDSDPVNTYWASDDGVKHAGLIFDFEKRIAFNNLLLQEHIALGQRVHKFTLEIDKDGNWEQVAEGTTIGYKRILRFDTVKTARARLTLQTDAPCLTLSNVGIYNAPPIMSDPVMKSDLSGSVSITGPEDASIYYAVGDRPASDNFKLYTGPIDLGNGGIVSAYALDNATGSESGIVRKQFGISKSEWKIIDCSFPNKGDASVKNLIDGNDSTMWHTHGPADRVKPPHFVIIDMGRAVEVAAFTCMPRHDGSSIGLVDRYTLHLSNDGVQWGDPIAAGEFENVKNNPIRQTVKLAKPVNARYIKFVAEHAVDANDCVAICEFGVISDK
ncbi:Sialidase precursor [Anaerohalosphaera lusitana]|uniref:alpha-L-fucosidase n=1 Tax=Anaerohalosphaera lusitana TaxID=1936003 RepID=A0A1U9NQ46_9BACT|nr:alpha-L-fucosidase [Anaerohalosphaera lusitana]AQT70029.1 Sialidase precursor [Anaerohalosphaera lusitana]